jgi:hypothetical protein
MAELKYLPVPHDQKAFLAKARTRKGFSRAYNALALEYQVAGQMLKARSRAGLTKTQSQSAWARPRAQSSALNQRANMLHRLQHSTAMRAL